MSSSGENMRSRFLACGAIRSGWNLESTALYWAMWHAGRRHLCRPKPSAQQLHHLYPPSPIMSSRMLQLLLLQIVHVHAGSGIGCYDVQQHKCDCTVTEAACHSQGGTWTDSCRTCDSATNVQHPTCQKSYSWGCFVEASHDCDCKVSERVCGETSGKQWTHECWSCCHTSSWGCYVPGDGAESGCHCDISNEGACKLAFPDATWSHQCHACSDTEAESNACRASTILLAGLPSLIRAVVA